jgi:hypothetical protein
MVKELQPEFGINSLLQLNDLKENYGQLFEFSNPSDNGQVDIEISFLEGDSRWENFDNLENLILELSSQNKIGASNRVAETIFDDQDEVFHNRYFITEYSDNLYLWNIYHDYDHDTDETTISIISCIEKKPESYDWLSAAGKLLEDLLGDNSGHYPQGGKVGGFPEWQEQMTAIIQGIHRQHWIAKLSAQEFFSKLSRVQVNFRSLEERLSLSTQLKDRLDDASSNSVNTDAEFWRRFHQDEMRSFSVNGVEFPDCICYYFALYLELEFYISEGKEPYKFWEFESIQDFTGLSSDPQGMFTIMKILNSIVFAD